MSSALLTDKPGDADMAPGATLQALLGKKDYFCYSAEGSSTVADYARDLVSLPSDAGGCDLYHSLPNSERQSVGVDFNCIFKSAEHVESNSSCPLPPSIGTRCSIVIVVFMLVSSKTYSIEE